jgi:DNA-binding IclR family transcriptional regulator
VSEIARTADHALRILEELGEGTPLSPGELCQRLDLNRTVVHRLLNTLSARGFVRCQDGAYRPGASLVRLAKMAEPDLRAVAVPVMSALARAAGETVVLHIIDGLQAVVLEQAPGTRHVVRVSHQIGSRHPLAVAASGRAILAFMQPGAAAKALKAAEEAAAVAASLEEIRGCGYALSHDELQMGVHGVAVPLRAPDRTAFGSIAILVPTTRAEGLERHAEALSSAARQIETAYLPARSQVSPSVSASEESMSYDAALEI